MVKIDLELILTARIAKKGISISNTIKENYNFYSFVVKKFCWYFNIKEGSYLVNTIRHPSK